SSVVGVTLDLTRTIIYGNTPICKGYIKKILFSVYSITTDEYAYFVPLNPYIASKASEQHLSLCTAYKIDSSDDP
uniref:hypothetical protein n=1 Tax=Bacillus licheniformis TaxID=1402 RepID=UPI001C3EF164